MKGFDFFMACYRKGVDLPVRIFADSKAPMNFYRPEAVCFINLEAGDEQKHEHIALLNRMDVSILAESVTDQVRDLTKLIAGYKPRHLVVLAGDTFASWAPHRGWK
jgi:hypothetical protein